MNLIIESKIDITKFCEWLIKEIQNYMQLNLNKQKASKFDEYINEHVLMYPKRLLSSSEIIIAAAYNLIIRKSQNSYIIELDPNRFIPNTSAKFISIINTINYGSLTLAPYPIFTETFNHFSNNIEEYLDIYLKEMS